MSARALPAIRRILPVILIALPVISPSAQTLSPAPAAETRTPTLMTLGDVQRGQLLFHSTRPGEYAPAPLCRDRG